MSARPMLATRLETASVLAEAPVVPAATEVRRSVAAYSTPRA